MVSLCFPLNKNSYLYLLYIMQYSSSFWIEIKNKSLLYIIKTFIQTFLSFVSLMALQIISVYLFWQYLCSTRRCSVPMLVCLGLNTLSKIITKCGYSYWAIIYHLLYMDTSSCMPGVSETYSHWRGWTTRRQRSREIKTMRRLLGKYPLSNTYIELCKS